MRTLMKPLASVRQWIVIASRAELSSQFSLTAPPARLRVSRVRTALRSVAHAAMRPYRGVGSWVPVCPSRERGGSRPRLRSSLWSVLPRQNDPGAASACVSGPTACLLASDKPGVKTHTHEYGSISSGWPPNQPASRIAKLFGESWLCGEVSRARECALVVSTALGKLLRPASWRLRRP